MIVILKHLEVHFVEAIIDAVDVERDQLDHLVKMQEGIGALAIGRQGIRPTILFLRLLQLQVDLVLLLEKVRCLRQRGDGHTSLLEELSHAHVARLKLLEVLAEFAELHNVVVEVLLEVGSVWVEV